MRKRSKEVAAFTLIEIMIVVAIIALLVAVAVPNYVRYRISTQRNLCIQNLSKIEAAKQTWGLENSKKTGDVPTDDELFGMAGYIKTKPDCPGGGVYEIHAIGDNATCTIPDHSL